MIKNEKQFFGPLTLHELCEKPSIFKSDESSECPCVICDENFTLPASEKQLLTHLFMAHRLVIADVNQIADLNEYLRYWRLRFKDNNLPYFCTTMLLDSKPDGTKSKDEEYFLLSNVLPEDSELRSNLQQKRLERLLEQHQFEREDKNFSRECLFCRFVSNDTRASYLNHLYEKHNFHIAKPDNLIFIDDLISMLSNKLESLHCIYCEGSFKDRTILKEHMRKKGHKRINPDNKDYDKYFMVNYIGDKPQFKSKFKSKQHTNKIFCTKPQMKDDHELDSNVDSDPEWSEWKEENSPQITCLLCKHTEPEFNQLLLHMEEAHTFSFNETTKSYDFYHKIKIVNYIRRKIHLKECLTCDLDFDNLVNLEKHLSEMKHLILSKENWDQPEYYFPTYEDDLFLCYIQDDDESWWSTDEQEVDKRNSMTESISKEMALLVLDE